MAVNVIVEDSTAFCNQPIILHSETRSNLQIARETDPPNDLMEINRPLDVEIRCGGALSCATDMRDVKAMPRPKPRTTAYPHTACELPVVADAIRAVAGKSVLSEIK
jgi:hypothetical protein